MPRKLLYGFLVVIAMMALHLPTEAQDVSPEQVLGGRPDSPVRIEVFSDFQCPACRTVYLETMKQVLRDYCALDKVCLIYREFPLKAHPYSRLAARYSLAAQRIGRKQWQAVLDSLYTNQAQWSLDGNVDATVARALGAEDMQKVRKLVQDASVNDAINRDLALGEQREIKSTPTIFIDALGRVQKVVGGLDYPILKEYIDRIIK
jgi:protein-disulfide isomerase